VKPLSVLALACFAACSPAVHSVLFVSPAPAPQPADHPIRFYQNTRPDCRFEELGSVTSRKRNSTISMQEVAESIRRRAREMGGDAVIGLTESIDTRGATVVNNSVIVNRDPVVAGTVIRFTDPACTH
jgi:hypothetical protein